MPKKKMRRELDRVSTQSPPVVACSSLSSPRSVPTDSKGNPLLDSQKAQVLVQMCKVRLPISVIGFVLNEPLHKIRCVRSSLGFEGRGTTLRRNAIYTVSKRVLSEMCQDQVRRFERLRNETVRAAAVECSTVEFKSDDMHPVDVLRHYRRTLPPLVLREFCGLNEKAFARICRALDLVLEPGMRTSLIRVAHDPSLVPDLRILSERQQERMNRILKRLRAEHAEQVETRKKASADRLWTELLALRASDNSEHLLCRGEFCKGKSRNSQWTWPRTNAFFHSTTDTPDLLMHFCKYCQLRKAQGRDQERKSTRKHVVGKKETSRLVNLFRDIGALVPAIYLERLFDLSRKQYQRICVLAKVERERGKGQHRLHRWRCLEEKDFPVFAGLSEAGMAKLRDIWRADVAAWKKVLEEEEASLLSAMEAEDARLAASYEKGAENAPPRQACGGGCGRRWHKSKINFPPTFRRYHGQCRICINRALRKQPGLK